MRSAGDGLPLASVRRHRGRRPHHRHLPLNIRVRLATEDDAFDILVVRAASWRAAYTDILPGPTLARLTASWDRKFPAGTWVVERDRLLVGYCITGVESLARVPAAVSLNELYVFPELWRTGLGSLLLERVLDELESRGTKEVVLDVLERNTRGIAFYEACGFRHVKSGDRVSHIDGQKFTVLQYRRSL